MTSDPLDHLEALHVGQHHVEDHEVRAERRHVGDRLLPRGCRGNFEALVAQDHRDDVDDVGLVVDDEDPVPGGHDGKDAHAPHAQAVRTLGDS